jgi:hypothetical protein
MWYAALQIAREFVHGQLSPLDVTGDYLFTAATVALAERLMNDIALWYYSGENRFRGSKSFKGPGYALVIYR